MLRPDAPPAEAYAGTLHVEPLISARLGDQQLAARVSIESGTFVRSARTAVPELLNIVVPRIGPDGTRWEPRLPRDPLARFGQYLDVALKLTEPRTGRSWTTRLGRCRIQESFPEGANIKVAAVGMMQRLEDHGIGRPSPPGRLASLASEAARLVSPTRLEVWVDPALRDRPIPEGITWGADRMATVLALAQAWPARVRSDVTGRVLFLPPLPEEVLPVVTLRDGEGGTVVSAPSRDTREGVYNHVVVSGRDDTKNGASFLKEALATVGPFSVRTYDTVTKPRIDAELVRTHAQAQAVADAELVKALSASRIVTVMTAPDYRLDIDVPIEVITHDRFGAVELREWGYITGVEVPLTAGDGDMRVDVGVFR